MRQCPHCAFEPSFRKDISGFSSAVCLVNETRWYTTVPTKHGDYGLRARLARICRMIVRLRTVVKDMSAASNVLSASWQALMQILMYLRQYPYCAARTECRTAVDPNMRERMHRPLQGLASPKMAVFSAPVMTLKSITGLP